jgi:hypothetical protein
MKKTLSLFKKSLVASTSIHLLALILAFGIPGCVGGKGNSKQGEEKPKKAGHVKAGEKQEIIEIDHKPLEVTIVTVPKSKGPGVKSKDLPKTCPSGKYFGGIGIAYGSGLEDVPGLIHKVYKGYPAELAGLQVGDIVLNEGEIRGKPNTIVQVTVKRKESGEWFYHTKTFTMIRDNICYDDVKKLKEDGK